MRPVARGRVLVVEDSAATRRAMTRVLQAHEVLEAADGESALDLLGRETVDLVVLDLGLPGIDGLEVLQRVRAEPATADVMVLLATARGETTEIVRGFEAAADDYIVKPFRHEELLARVNNALRLKQLRDELQRINENLEHEVQARTSQLVAAQKFALVGRNAAQIVHNLNSPLTALLGYIELAQRVPPEQLPGVLERLEAVAVEMRHIIGGVLTGVRGREAMPEAQPLSLNDIVHEQCAFWQVDARFRYEVDIVLDLAPSLPPVRAIRTDLHQIATNLIDNALDAVAGVDEPRLSLRTRVNGEQVHLAVSDNGAGIAPEHIDRVFEPTFTTKPIGEGTGLGLASCLELATANGGRLEVDSAPRRGTTMALVLPCYRENGA